MQDKKFRSLNDNARQCGEWSFLDYMYKNFWDGSSAKLRVASIVSKHEGESSSNRNTLRQDKYL